jgi:rare lipoprotein A
MRRFRTWRRRRAALALFPATVAMTMIIATGIGAAADAGSASFDANKAKVKPGDKVKLTGTFPARAQTLADGTSTRAGRRVRIEFRPAGKRAWRPGKTIVSDAKGNYTRRVKVRRSGFYRAVHNDGRVSSGERIRVKAKLNAEIKRRHAKLGQKVPIKGSVKPSLTRRKVVVRIGGDKLKTRTDRSGKFKVHWKADKTGSYKAKVKAKGDKVAAGNGDKAGRTTVYRPAVASYYGPGFYGNRTACGQTLTTSTVGVAHKTMPCGTKLTLRYGSRTVKVEVIDRGPYVAGREFDLTTATKQKLGFGSTGTVWASK